MSGKIISRVVGSVDERMPLHSFLAESRKQAEAMPLEIIEDGVVYEAFDVKMKVEGTNNIATAFYKEKNEPPHTR